MGTRRRPHLTAVIRWISSMLSRMTTGASATSTMIGSLERSSMLDLNLSDDSAKRKRDGEGSAANGLAAASTTARPGGGQSENLSRNLMISQCEILITARLRHLSFFVGSPDFRSSGASPFGTLFVLCNTLRPL